MERWFVLCRSGDQAMRRAQDAAALTPVEGPGRLGEGKPADPALLERRDAPFIGHQEVRDCDAFAFLLVLDGPQAPDQPRAHASLLAHLAQRRSRARFPVL